ncbi:histidine phosphatase family protein [Nonomuraea ferruginea]
MGGVRAAGAGGAARRAAPWHGDTGRGRTRGRCVARVDGACPQHVGVIGGVAMAVIYLVRHGQASFGAADYDALSELGRHQARLVGQELLGRAREPLLVSGSLRRQKDTAALLGLPVAVPVEDPRWNEYDHLGLVRRYLDDGTSQTTGDSRQFQTHLDQALKQWIEQGHPGGWDTFSQLRGRGAARHPRPSRAWSGRCRGDLQPASSPPRQARSWGSRPPASSHSIASW